MNADTTNGGDGSPAPADAYQQEIDQGILTPDPSQAEAVELCQQLYEQLCASQPGSSVWSRLKRRFGGGAPELVRGLYFWGGVGRGKTHIMNLFHRALPFERKLRIHFHGFMLNVHRDLKALDGEEDPLRIVARDMAERYRVICFDEFHVSDIADAMILGKLLDELFARGVTLVATSNIEPDGLYKGGLQRERFLPAIAALKRHTTVYHYASPTDYRLRALSRAAIYHSPLGADADRGMQACWDSLRPEQARERESIDVAGRPVETRRLAEGIVWFDFAAICETARSASDYIEIGQRFHTVLLSDIPVMDDKARDRVLRFIHLVDELYEQSVNLIVSAATEPDHLYEGARLEVGFARARSRLQEMRSMEYLARPHLAHPE